MSINTSSTGGSHSRYPGFWTVFVLLAVILYILFLQGFLPGRVVFSNDGPLGVVQSQADIAMSNFLGYWTDLNWVGSRQPGAMPNITHTIYMLTGHSPVWFSRVYAPASLLILGGCAWFFFRRAGFHPWVCLLGALAATLNSNVFSNSCWGLPTRALTLAGVFLALTALQRDNGYRSWIRAALAGAALGISLMEGYDVAAIFSLYVAGYALFVACAEKGLKAQSFVHGIGRIVVVALVAAVVSTQTLNALFETQVKGVVSSQQDQMSPEEHWDWATQWSLPKVETLRVIIPGLFGYRLDTPDGGNYWGTVGQQPGWQQHHQGFPRHSGSGEYAGLLVVLFAIWAAVHAFRRKDNIFDSHERRHILFWTAVAVGSLILAFGRYGTLYRLIYHLPFISTIRNPIKFMHPCHLALLILFGYGLQGAFRFYLERTSATRKGVVEQIKSWWRLPSNFDKRFIVGTLVFFAIGVLGLMLFSSSSKDFLQSLQSTGISSDNAVAIQRFASMEILNFLGLLLVCVGIVVLVFSGVLSGIRSRWAMILLGFVLVADLARADRPWIITYNYREKYATSPIIELLRQKAYEQRVTVLPFQVNDQMNLLSQLYGGEWMQHHFQYYNIESLDLVQESRVAVDNAAYRAALPRNNPKTLLRLWELTNTRYILGLGGDFVQTLNQQLDPEKKRFRLHAGFNLVPLVTPATRFEDLTTEISSNGQYGVLEFTGALPRVLLLSHWLVFANDAEILKNLADPQFDPHRTALLQEEVPLKQSVGSANDDAGTASIESYAPKQIRVTACAKTNSILLYNDKYDSGWHAWVDGKETPIFRCNYLMRGISLQPGEHIVEFRFTPPVTSLYVSLVGLAVSGVLVMFLLVSGKEEKEKLSSANQ
jgi:hypothetical protein